MSKIPIPMNVGILERASNALGQIWFQFLSNLAKRINAAAAVTTLTDDGVTISNPPTQAEVQAIAAKLTALQNSLK